MPEPTPQRQHVLQWLSPDVRDILFYETVDATRPIAGKKRFEIPEYGTAHPDEDRWPDHELVFAKQADQQGQFYHFYYAVRRQEQDRHNLQFNRGQEVVRTYILPRDRSEGSSGEPTDLPERNVNFSQGEWAFADMTFRRIDGPLDGLYVAVQYRWIEAVAVEQGYDVEFGVPIEITKRVVPSGYRPENSPPAGTWTEVKHGNIYHSISITKSVNTGDIELPSIPTFVNYRFPEKLVSVTIRWAAAWAYSNVAPPAYDEDMYFDVVTQAAKPGPYPAVIERTVSRNPSGINTNVGTVPNPIRATVGMIYAYWSAGTRNVAQAVAKQITLPLAVNSGVSVGIDGEGSPGANAILSRLTTKSIPATGLPSGDMVVAVDVKPTRYGLYLVSVTRMQAGSLY